MSVRAFAAICVTLLAVMPAFSAITTYTQRSLWETDVATFESVTFEDLVSGSFGSTGAVLYDGTSSSVVTSCPSVAAEQACFQNNAFFQYSVVNGTGPAPAGNQHFRLGDGSGTLQINTDPATMSFAIEAYTVSIDNRPLTVTLFADTAGTTILNTITDVTPGFFGVVSTDSIAMIRLSSGGFSEIYLDRFDFAGAPGGGGGGETPEATSFTYMALGTLAIYFGTRKRTVSAS
jgi:hypothetical protein